MLAEFSIIPIGKGVSLSKHVAKAVKLVDQSGLDYRLTPMGTIVEGKPNEIFRLIKKCYQVVLKDASRVVVHISLDERKDKKGPRLSNKVKAVENKIGRKLKVI